ncbi:alpha-glucosidase [Thermanaerothrix sp.]|jgi:alpha-glucosidase|uniref:glycoside hydrolase family 13 protein n=1 Tax=Thermanaerothrix sp. TaxID=2972675 RepID=UPI002ADD39F3|nr:alpha-glucosidase [Thermanaerothrix sp.]
MTSQNSWWQEAVFYQIYPRSFADGNGDGIGDIEGIIRSLDYLQWLGIDAIWLSPHYPSPQVDCGYDISDYYGVAPEYGSLNDFKRLLKEIQRRNMRLILDLVLNHTSDQHPWFQESRSSRTNPRRNWYIWREGRNGEPPNDWCSTFGGSAWTFDATTGMYYYHFFFKEQPDLNWRNPEVKAAMFDVVHYWLEMGVDGFRLDAVGTIFEHPDLPPHGKDYGIDDLYVKLRKARTPEEQRQVRRLFDELVRYQVDMPEVHDLMRQLRTVVDEFPSKVLVGESEEIAFYGNGYDELHLVFNFPLMRTRRITPQWVLQNQRERLAQLPSGAWPCNTLGNHDSSRIRSAFGDGVHDEGLMRVLAALVLTLKGTPFLYNGEEIGMTDYLFTDVSRFRDPLALRAYDLEVRLLGTPPSDAAFHAAAYGRDKCRTPMQWRNAPNAGFCPKDVEPWLPVNPNYREGINVADQERDGGSLLHFYHDLLQVRRCSPALRHGEYQPLSDETKDYLLFLRSAPEQTCLVALNFSPHPQDIDLSSGLGNVRLMFSSQGARQTEVHQGLRLAPFEVWIGEVVEPLTPS